MRSGPDSPPGERGPLLTPAAEPFRPLIPPSSQDPNQSINRGTEAETAVLSGLSDPVLAGPKGRSEDDYFPLTDPSHLAK